MVYKKVAIYLRKSRLDLELEGQEETLARHERILIDYCNRNNLDIAKIYKEVVSGEDIENRPIVQQLLRDVQEGLYEGVVVVELERLSRGNQIDQVEIAETFKNSNTKIYTLNKVYDLSSEDSFDEDFFEFGLFMSRREYKIIKSRLIRGKKQAQKEGYFVGCVTPFGYSKEKQGKGFVLIPDNNAEIVQLIFNKYVHEDWSLSQVRDFLNNNGMKPLKAKNWSNERLRHLLKNKVYLGLIGFEIKKNPTYFEGKHVAIIDEKTFEKATDKLSVNAPKMRLDRTLKNPFSSVMFCSKCGCTMKLKNSRSIPFLACDTLGCQTIGAYLKEVEEKVIDELQVELKRYNYFIENCSEEIENKKRQANNEITLLNKELNKKNNMIDKCCEMLEEGIYTKEKYLQRVNTLEKEIEVIKSNIKTLKNETFDDTEKIKTAIPILSKVLNEYWSLTPENKNKLLKGIASKIIYSKATRNKQLLQKDTNFTLQIYMKI